MSQSRVVRLARLAPYASLLAIASSISSPACKPDLGPPDSLVERTQLLAVKAEPAEVKPGATVIYRVLVASPEGTVDRPDVAWSYCDAPKPVTENNIVNATCLGALTPFADPSPVAAGVVPGDACANFGPDAPPGGFRPRDADVTGGYYQPVRASFGGEDSFFLQRVTCNLANTSADLAREYSQKYVSNANPTLDPIALSRGGVAVARDTVPAGARIDLRASWPAEDAETYVRLNPDTQQIEAHREAIRVSWFATGGTFDRDRTGRTEDEMESTSDNAWTAPTAPGAVTVWVVLRDSRGGLDFASVPLVVVR